MSPASAPHFSVAPVGRRARTPGAMARKKGKARPGGSASAPVPPGEDAPPPDAAATDRGDADPAGDGAVVSPAVPPSPAAVDVDAVALDLEPSDGEAADDERGDPGSGGDPGPWVGAPGGSSPARGPPSSSSSPVHPHLASAGARARRTSEGDVRAPSPPLAAARRSSENLAPAAAAAAGAAATEVASASPPESRPAGTMGMIDYGLGLRSPGFLRSLRRGRGSRKSDDGEADEEAQKTARKEKKKAKKARRRLKRLVHRTNTMGAAVSAKEQTTTQLGLCMQIGVALGLADQPPANTFEDVSDERLAETDESKHLDVEPLAVEDGTTLPAFRFVVHAPSRFERVRNAWGLGLRNYALGFKLEPAPPTEASNAEAGAEGAPPGRHSEDAAAEGAEASATKATPRASAELSEARGADAGGGADSEASADKTIVGEPEPETGSRAEAARRWVRGVSIDEGDETSAGLGGDLDLGLDLGSSSPAAEGRSAAEFYGGGGGGGGAAPPGSHHARAGSRRHRRAFSVGSSVTDGYGSEDGGGARFSDGSRHESQGPEGEDRRVSDFGAEGSPTRVPSPVPSATSLRVISTASASGKSSSWFFCSKDGRFLVKTCTTKERDVLLDILDGYGKHARENRGTSLLPQYYGLYTVEVGSRSAHFIIMNYWFATMHEIRRRYDLKGSTWGRRASAKEREKGKSATLKDLDYRDERRVVSNPNVADVKRAIAKDVAFMEKNRLIDYSMMLGLHYAEDGEPNAGTGGDQRGAPGGPSEAVPVPGMDVSPPPSPMADVGSAGARPDSGGETSGGERAAFSARAEGAPPSDGRRGSLSEGGEAHEGGAEGPFATFAADDTRTRFQLRALETPFGLAYLGIIDILTQYGPLKTAEHCLFSALCCGADISCQPPERYARRFRAFIDEILVEPDADPSTRSGAGGRASRRGSAKRLAAFEIEPGGGKDEQRGPRGSPGARRPARSLEVELEEAAGRGGGGVKAERPDAGDDAEPSDARRGEA